MINYVQAVQAVQALVCRVKATPDMGCAGCAGLKLLFTYVRAQRPVFNFKTSIPPCTPCTPCTSLVLSMFLIFLPCTLPYTFLFTHAHYEK